MHLKSEWSEGRRREEQEAAKNEQLISTTNKRQSSSYTMTNKRPSQRSSHSNKAHYITLSVLILTYLFSIVNCSVQHLNNHEPAEKNMMSAKNSLNNYRHANKVRNVSKSTYHRPTNDLTDDLENDLETTTTTTKSAAPSNSDQSSASSSSAMIDAFKMKLLKLLELDKAPEPSEINLNENPIPEPILRELVQLSETERRRRQRNTPHHHHSASSRVRSRRSLDDDDDQDGDDDDELVKDDSDEDSDEQQNVISEKIDEMRFNGSVVQQVTLLPKKFDAHQIEDSEWCSEMISHSDDQDDVIGGGGDGEEQIINSNKNRKFQHYQTRKHHQQQTNNGFFTLNCMYFDLEQREFSLYEIRSADLYVKLDLDELNDIFNPNSESPLESAVSNLYIQVNGRLVKKINLITLREEQLDQGETNEGNEEWSTTNYDMDSQESSVFDYANITTLIRETVQQSIDKSPVIRVKIMSRLAGSSLAMKNSTRERHLLRKMFSHVDEQMALHVRFGSIRATSLQETVLSRSRRQAPGRRSYSKQSSHHHHHHQSSKTYRDCSELRKAGYTRANFSCCRETISFSMEQIGWSHWILSPKVIEYKYCRGGCLTGSSPRFENTQIVYKMFELSHSFESSHCCNIYDYEDDIPFIFGTPPSYQTKMVSLNAKNCLCS